MRAFIFLLIVLLSGCQSMSDANDSQVEIGVRPHYLISQMENSALKTVLQTCKGEHFKKSDFSIGHRGAPLQFPEHTKESYLAAVKMGAGILECDVTFTKDKALVCRHSQCDLHQTTNVLAKPALAKKCRVPFTPGDRTLGKKALVECCTSDFTQAEFLQLTGKMDGANVYAKTPEEYLAGTPNWRTDLYSATGTLMTHQQSIALFKRLGVKMTPELKRPKVTMPFEHMSQTEYAKQLINEYKKVGISPSDVFVQSFELGDLKYWIQHHPEFAKQAVYLDDGYEQTGFNHNNPETWQHSMTDLKAMGINIIAPPLWVLVSLDENNQLIESAYAIEAKKAGLTIITWTLERSGLLTQGGGFYYQSVKDAIKNEGFAFELLDFLAKQVGVIGVFSDWPATTTFYSNCVLSRS